MTSIKYASYINSDTSLEDSLGLINNNIPDEKYDDRIDMNQSVGWGTVTSWNSLTSRLFTKRTLNVIRDKTSEYLTGVDPKGRKIIPSDDVMTDALYSIFRHHIPQTGDIYGRYSIRDESNRDDYAYIIDKTISLIVTGIRTDIEMQEQNEKLSIWTTVLGDFNEHGIRSNAPIKLRHKRPDPMLFHMRY
jgi:hypothetical protein